VWLENKKRNERMKLKIVIFTSLIFLFIFVKTVKAERTYRLSLSECVALADDVISGQVLKIIPNPQKAEKQNAIATIKVNYSFKNKILEKEIKIKYETAIGIKPSPIVLNENQTYLFFLLDKFTGEDENRLIDKYDGAILLNSVINSEIPNILKQSLSSWKTNSNGLRTKIFSDKYVYEIEDDINLKLFIMNFSDTSIFLEFSDWPLDKHSYCSLKLKNEDYIINSKKIDWLTINDITNYFSQHGKNHKIELMPGMFHIIYLNKINSAAKGWGYKENLNFEYYPTIKLGKYTVSVEIHNISTLNPILTPEINYYMISKAR